MTATATATKPLTLRHHFKKLLANIEPPVDRRLKAQSIPADVREYLKTHADFATQTPHTRLVGSYARETAIRSIKDVDILVFVKEGDERPDPVTVLDTLYDVLDGLPEDLGSTGQVTTLRRQRRSIHVHFEAEDFRLDVVPAIIPDGMDSPLLVPDKEWEEWIDSAPLGYAAALSVLNQAHGEKVVPLIKLFKHWRGFQIVRGRPKSYYLEALVYRHVNAGLVTTEGKSYAELFTDLLVSIRDEFLPYLDEAEAVPTIADPTLGHNVAFNWERWAFERFMNRLNESIGWATRALAKTPEQLDEAIVLWQKVFGADAFADTPDLRKAQFAETLARGPAFVSSAGKLFSQRPDDTRVVQSPPHRFYGDEV